jgi:hypothetical protein
MMKTIIEKPIDRLKPETRKEYPLHPRLRQRKDVPSINGITDFFPLYECNDSRINYIGYNAQHKVLRAGYPLMGISKDFLNVTPTDFQNFLQMLHENGNNDSTISDTLEKKFRPTGADRTVITR